MTSLILHYAGPPEQKHAVKVPPMAPLSSVLLEVCAKLRPAVDAGAVELHVAGVAIKLGK